MRKLNLFLTCMFVVGLFVAHCSVFAQTTKKAAIISIKDDLNEHNGDAALRDKLVNLGFEVVSYRDGDLDGGKVEQSEFESNDLIVASESVSGSKLRKLRSWEFSVPTINMEVASVTNTHHTLELISVGINGNGWFPKDDDNAYRIKILDGEHPLAAGLSTGEVIDLVSDPGCIDEDPFAYGYIGWMVDEIGLIPIASINTEGGDTSIVIAGIEKGTVQVEGIAFKARYVQFNVNSFTPLSWTESTERLFEAAIEWVMDAATSVDGQHTANTPSKFSLSQNYPNPFNPTTIISYNLPKSDYVELKVYDMLGREISTLVNEQKSAGKYDVKFDASGLASGMYFYKIITNDFRQIKKMMLVR